MPTFFPLKPNAGAHLPPEAGARHEQRLEAVRCSAVLDLVWISGCASLPTVLHGCAPERM